MNIVNLVEQKGVSEFYPTPEKLVKKMLEGVEWYAVGTVLEPSAGKGDILRCIADKSRDYHNQVDVDCCEIDSNLRAILKYNFSREKEAEINKRIRTIEDCKVYDREARAYTELTNEQKIEMMNLKAEKRRFFNNGIHVVHDDFLKLKTYKHYDLIVMNPPFSCGDKHLLKALKMQECGGNIICLLNAETIRNPYTETRKILQEQLQKYGATIEFLEEEFVDAERRTEVEIALVKVHIEKTVDESDIYERMKKAENVDDSIGETTDLTFADYLKAIVSQFNVEVRSGLELIRQYNSLKPYILNSVTESKYNSPILELKYSGEQNEYVKRVRSKYWTALLSNTKFVGKLTSKLQDEYRRKIDTLVDYDFNEFNIDAIAAEMNAEIKCGIEDEIITMFDKFTTEHSYYPECSKNKHLYDGWKTNVAHKIGKKVILPCYGIFGSWDGKPRTYEARDSLMDIERILNYFDGNMTEEVEMDKVIERNFSVGVTKNIKCKFFTVTFYKKGTVHIVFNCPELIERFNIYAAQQKQWLPPAYGKKTYNNMTEDEKAVVDSFQGEKAYGEVLKNSSYYLAPVVQNQLQLSC